MIKLFDKIKQFMLDRERKRDADERAREIRSFRFPATARQATFVSAFDDTGTNRKTLLHDTYRHIRSAAKQGKFYMERAFETEAEIAAVADYLLSAGYFVKHLGERNGQYFLQVQWDLDHTGSRACFAE